MYDLLQSCFTIKEAAHEWPYSRAANCWLHRPRSYSEEMSSLQ